MKVYELIADLSDFPLARDPEGNGFSVADDAFSEGEYDENEAGNSEAFMGEDCVQELIDEGDRTRPYKPNAIALWPTR